MKIAQAVPYTTEELQRVLAYEPVGPTKHGICDWCGGPLSPTQRRCAYICHRCWRNRLQIHAAIADGNSVARAPLPAPDDASSDRSANTGHGGVVSMTSSIPRNEREAGFYVAHSSRTDPTGNPSKIAMCDRGKENGSRTFPNALRDQKDPRSIRMSFPNSHKPWAVLGALINEGGR